MNKKLLILPLLLSAILSTGCSKQTSEDHVQNAQKFIQEGNNNAAIVELKNAVQLAPRQSQPRFELGKLYLATNSYESAEKELSRALEYGHTASEVIPLLTRAYQRTGSNAAIAEVDIESASLTVVEQVEIAFYKAQSLIQLDKEGEARTLINQYRDADTRSAYKGLLLVLDKIMSENYESALDDILQLKEQSPLNKDVLSLNARLYMNLGQPDEAANTFAEYVNAVPNDLETRFALASMLVTQKRTKEAEPHVDMLLEVNPDNGLLNQLKSIIRAAENDFESALEHAERAINNGRTDPIVRLIAGFAAYQQGDYNTSVAHLSVISPVLPDNHPGLRILAASQLQVGMSTEANDVLARIGDVSAQDASLFTRAGYELIKSGNIKDAKEIVAKSNEISDSADDLTRLGVLKLSLNDVEGILDLEEAVSKAPDSVTAQTTLATAYLSAQQFDKASKLANKWKKDKPNDVRAYLLAGQIAQRQQNYSKALSEYEQAEVLNPNEKNVQMALVSLSFSKGDLSDADARLNKMLAKDDKDLSTLGAYFAIHSQQSDPEKGMKPALEALKEHSSDIPLRLLVSRMQMAAKEIDGALSTLKPIKGDKNAPRTFWPIKGQALLASNAITDAKIHYQEWNKLFPNDKNAVLGQLLLLDGENKHADGLTLADSFLSQRDDMQVKILQNYFAVMIGDINRAENIYAEIPSDIKPLPFVRGINARMALLRNKPAEALGDAQAAFDNSPVSRNLMLLLRTMELNDRSEDGYQLLKDFVANNPRELSSLMLLAEKEIANDPSIAISRYKTALTLNENNFVVLNNLAYLLMLNNNLSDAKDYAQRAIALKPNDAATADTYAQILVKQDNFEEAVKVYNRVVDSDMKNEEVYLNYVEALLLDGKKVIASRRLKERTLTLPKSEKRASELKTKFNL